MQFQDIMAVKFNEIKHNFICASKKNGLDFNEDIFIDSYIKCNETLKNKQVAVIRIEDKAKYTSTEDMKDAIIAVEAGSAGQLCVVKGE